MAKQRTRTQSSRTKLDSRSTSIKCRIDLLPVKSLTYAMRFLLNKGPAQYSGTKRVGQARSALDGLDSVRAKLDSGTPVPQSEMDKILENAATSYVELYYSLGRAIHDSILRDCLAWRTPSEGKRNIITMPAYAFQNGYPKESLIAEIKNGLQIKPYSVLHSMLKSSERIETLRASLSLRKTQSRTALSAISAAQKSLEEVMRSIGSGAVSAEHESRKDRVISEIASFSDKHEVNTYDYINWKLDEMTFNMRSAQRIIRQ